MQGLVGCYSKKQPTDSQVSPRQALDRMLAPKRAETSAAVNTVRFDFPQFSLAALSLEHAPRAFRPEYRTTGSRHIITDGFIKDKQVFLNELVSLGDLSFPTSLAAHSGVYNTICFDENTGGLLMFNDRHGGRYLYCYEDDDWFVFAPNVLTVVASGLVKSKDLDYEAIISLISHEYIMGERSLVKSIKLFPFASYMMLAGTRRETVRYWNFESLAEPKHTDKYDDLLDKGISLIRSAVGAYASEDAEIIVPLSGGLDSRTIASFLSEHVDKAECRALHVDYGFEKKLARRVAKTLGIDFETSPRTDFQVWRSIDPFILCAGQSIHQFWVYPHLERKLAKGFGTLIIDGYLMNEVIGGLSTLGAGGYADMNRRYPPLHRNLDFVLGSRIKEDYFARHDAQINEILSTCPGESDYDRFLYFTILSYGRRFTLLFSIIHGYLASVGLPVLDYDLLEFCLKMPRELKASSRFYRDLVSRAFPDIARIPWSRNRLPLNSPKDRHFICGCLDRIGLYKYYLSRITHTRYEAMPKYNKNRMFRKNKRCREYFMDIIFDDRTFDKGYVSEPGLRRLVDLIDTGRNHFDILEKVAVIELVSREVEGL